MNISHAKYCAERYVSDEGLRELECSFQKSCIAELLFIRTTFLRSSYQIFKWYGKKTMFDIKDLFLTHSSIAVCPM